MKRNRNIDHIKGFLVLAMIAYHCSSASTFPAVRQIRGHLSFLHYSFLIISGYLCGMHYFPRLNEHRGALRRRIISRAIRIMILFLVANVVFHILGLADRTALSELAAHPSSVLTAMFVTIDGSYVAFEVLYYISMCLVLISVLFTLRSMRSILCSSLVVVGVAMVLPGQCVVFMGMGCVGLAAGMLASRGYLDSFYQTLLRLPLLPVAFLLADMLLLSDIRSDGAHYIVIPLRLTESCCWFYVAVWTLSKLSDHHMMRGAIASLGQYTLLSYLVQMPCARIVNHAFGGPSWIGPFHYMVCVAIVFAFTLSVVLCVKWLREESEIVNVIYMRGFQ